MIRLINGQNLIILNEQKLYYYRQIHYKTSLILTRVCIILFMMFAWLVECVHTRSHCTVWYTTSLYCMFDIDIIIIIDRMKLTNLISIGMVFFIRVIVGIVGLVWLILIIWLQVCAIISGGWQRFGYRLSMTQKERKNYRRFCVYQSEV